MKRHFMIDLETMGTRPGSAIVSIGAVEFDDRQVYQTFYRPINLQSSYDAGLTFDQDTVDWWAKQPAEIRAAWEVPDAPTLTDVLKEFQDWLWLRANGKGNVCVWGNGADFDMVLLRGAYNALGVDEPWKYYNVNCFRTMKNHFVLDPEDLPKREGAHRADADALFQTKHLQSILQVYSLSLPS